MYQVQIEIFELQIRQRLLARWNHVGLAVLVVPQLRCDPDVVAPEAALEEFFEYLADLNLIAVYGCTVKMPIADGSGILHRIGDGLA